MAETRTLRGNMSGVPSQVVNRLRLLLLAVACGLGFVPTAHALRAPTPAGPQLKEESALPEPSAAYVVCVIDGEMRIGLFVVNDPINNTDPYGLWIGTRLFRIYKVWKENNAIKRELVREIKNKNLRDSMKEMEEALDSIKPPNKRVVEAENGVSAEGIAKKLSENKQCRGPEGKPPYNRHYNPKEGPYKDVHVEPGFSQLAAMALIPHAYEASNTEGITTGEFSATAAWDVLNGIDPVGVTDLMEWLFIK